MKIVNKLNKKKHRHDLWVDIYGCVWYFDLDDHGWRILIQTKAGLAWVNDISVETKGWPDGPYERILKGRRA